MEDRPPVGAITPLYIVADAAASLAFYRRMGFALLYQEEGFAMLARDAARVMVKAVDGTPALPNPSRHPWVKWDAYIATPDPDRLAAEFASAGVPFHRAIGDTSDGQRGFEIADPDGYVLFFGRPGLEGSEPK